MNTTKSGIWFGCAAAVCLAIGSGRALGQYRVGADGHANDANPQVGSGGYNTGADHPVNPAITGQNNLIEQGNVSGLNSFHGRTPNEDPTAFIGSVPNSPSDNLNRVVGGSGGAPGGFIAPGANNTITPYFNTNTRFVPAPTGYVPVGNTGGFVPGPTVTPSPNDARLGISDDVTYVPLPSPDNASAPGPVSLSGDQSIYTASPLYGVKQWHLDEAGNMIADVEQNPLAAMPMAGNPSQPPPTFGGGAPPLSNSTIENIRNEINANAANTQTNTGATGNTNPDGGNSPSVNPPGVNNPAGPAGFVPVIPQPSGGQLMSNKPLSNVLSTGQAPLPNGRVEAGVIVAPINGQSVNTGQATRYQPIALVEPGKQSTQYQALQKRLAEYESQMQNANLTDEQRHNLAVKEQQTIKEMSQPAQAGAFTVPGAGGAGGPGGPTSQPVSPRNTSVGPVQIDSMAEGMASRSLGEILKNAEDLVHQGKYKEAIDQYNNAAVIVPNNPMIMLGRANAEIGANLYVRAETDIRKAFAADTALMMAKFNLDGLLGQKRLDAIIADLEQVSDKSPSNETPVFLLAYLDYNTGQVTKVASRLELAERLMGGHDPLIESLFQHWNFSTTQPAGN